MAKYSYEIMDVSIQAMGVMTHPATDTVKGYFAQSSRQKYFNSNLLNCLESFFGY